MEYSTYRREIYKFDIDPERPSIPPKTFGSKVIRTVSITEKGWYTAAVLARLLNTSKSNVIELCLRYFESDKEELIHYKDNYIKAMMK